MFIRISSITDDSITLESGVGPSRIGQYHNASEFRVATALAASIASTLQDTAVAIVGRELSRSRLPECLQVRGGGELRQISVQEVTGTRRGGWIDLGEGHVIVLPDDRASMEEACYALFGISELLIVPERIREHVRTVDDLRANVNRDKLVSINPDYSDIEITMCAGWVRDVVVSRTARVMEDFNQTWSTVEQL